MQRMLLYRAASCVIFFLWVTTSPVLAQPGMVTLEPGFTLVDAQGKRFALAEIVPPAYDRAQIEAAERWLREALAETNWTPHAIRAPDRYGRREAGWRDAEGHDLAKAMLRAGMARVSFDIADPERAQTLLALERAAREAQRGLWPQWGAVSFAEAGALSGQYGFVEGTVQRIDTHKGHRFLSFGEDWRTDPTGFIPAKAVPRFAMPPLEALVGQKVRLRGWIEERNGPSMLLVQPYAIEVLP